MKKNILLIPRNFFLILVLIIIIFFVNNQINNTLKIEVDDEINVIKIVTSYYDAIEENDFISMLSSFEDKYHEKLLENRATYENINEELQYGLKFNYIVKNSLKPIERNKLEIMVSVFIDYANVEGGYIVETIKLYKKNDKWFIEEIESFDKYVSLRSHNYILNPIQPWFLKGSK